MSARIFVYGEVGPDNLILVPWLPDAERAAPVLSDSYHPGGAASNVAILLAHWEAPTCLGGNALGDDEMGRRMLAFLCSYPQLDLSPLRVIPGAHTPFCRIIIPPNGDRLVLFYNAERTTLFELSEEQLDGCRLLVLDNNGGEERARAACLARRLGVEMVAGDVLCLEDPILPYADWIVNSAKLMAQKLPGVDVEEHLRALQAASGAGLITSDGGHPVQVRTVGGPAFQVIPPVVEVVDVTGAGDALKAGVCYGRLQRWPIEDCVRFGVAAGALTVGRVGACTQPPTREEVAQLAERLSVEAL